MTFLLKLLKPVSVTGLASLSLLVFVQGVSFAPPPVDHAAILRSLNKSTLEKGREIYLKACAACHGTNGVASFPQARSFTRDALRFGNKPYDMWKTITNGAGMMAAQTWLKPEERYYVIQYIRESFIKPTNSSQYYRMTPGYLATLPKVQPATKDQAALVKSEAKKGSLQYGQEWFSKSSSDYGPAIYSQLKSGTTSALTIALADRRYISYDLLRMKSAALWEGMLNLSETKYKLYRGEGQPYVEGKLAEGLQAWQWIYTPEHESLIRSTGKRAVPDVSVFRYRGHYLWDSRVILSYIIEGREVLEMPTVQRFVDGMVLSQRLTLGAGGVSKLIIGRVDDSTGVVHGSLDAQGNFAEGGTTLPGKGLLVIQRNMKNGQGWVAAAISGMVDGLSWEINDNHEMVLTIPASSSEITITVKRKSGTGLMPLKLFGQQSMRGDDNSSLAAQVRSLKPSVPSIQVTKGIVNAARPHFDPRYYKDKDKTAISKLVNIPLDYPYTVDQLTLPYDNRYNAWIRPTAACFDARGTLFVSTYVGDVWMASGIDSALSKITWQRIASGLYEPMGIRVVNEELLVTCRNGIMRLKDLNGDKQVDFYEQMHADHDVSSFFHAFNFGLEKDSRGNLYYVKPGEYTDNKDPGNVMRISPDGAKAESIATGFRVNNGITISPDDRIFVSDNQGNWTPANKINVIENGKYYGYVPNLLSGGWSPDGKSFPKDKIVDGVISEELVKVPASFTPPALWMPQEFDNSPGGGTWSDSAWGPLGNSFIHTSYGTGWSYYVMPKQVSGIWQASMIALPFQFDAGIQRATVNPADRNVYVTGLTGWDDGVAQSYGTLSRIRYTGGQGHFIKDVEVISTGIRLVFNFAVDKASLDTSDFEISMWNYKWTSNYGSAHYSVRYPGTENEDHLDISGFETSKSGDTLDISIPDLQEANTVRVRLRVKATDGNVVNESIYMTINKMPLP